MKVIVFECLMAIVFCVVPIFSFAQKENVEGQVFRIKGCLADVKQSLVVYSVDYGAYLGKALDTIPVKEGRVDASIPLDKPTYIMLFEPFDKKTAVNVARIRFPGIPGEEINLEGRMDDYMISGSAFYQDYGRVDILLQDIYKKRETLPSCGKKILDYVRQYPDEDATAVLIPFVREEDFPEALACLSERVRNGRMAASIQANIEQRKVRKAMDESRIMIQVGMKAPAFSASDINGNLLSLSSFAGKYVLLDFWGAWCGPCMKGMPVLKEYYGKYGDRMEIIGIDCRDSEQKWKATVLNNQLPWKHVQDGKDKDITTKYAVESFPTLILIDPQGVIIKIADKDKETFFEYIDALF